MSRIGISSCVLAFALVGKVALAAEEPAAWRSNGGGWDVVAGRAVIHFSREKGPGLYSILDTNRNFYWSDSAYKWDLKLSRGDGPDPVDLVECTALKDPVIRFEGREGESYLVRVSGKMAGCGIEADYRIGTNGDWFEEQITVANETPGPVRILDWDFGPSRRINGGTWPAPLKEVAGLRAAAIPWRRQIYDPHTVQDYDLKTLLSLWGGQNPLSSASFHLIPMSRGLPSEAWALLEGGIGLLVTKYSPDHIEYSVLRHELREGPHVGPSGYDNVARESRNEYLLFGGSNRCRQDPTPDCLKPGEKYAFGMTRYDLFDGGWQDGFASFKADMNRWDCGLPSNYDTYVHWNELYDNPTKWYEWGEALKKSKLEHYRLADLYGHARKAVDYHCETLYLDPGWDTLLASSIWDEARLGRFTDFVAKMKRDYGLRVGLHVPLAAWCDMSSYPPAAFRMDREGRRLDSLCGGSRQYLAAKAERLCKLAREGASFLMFDGSFYTGLCYDPEHGHPIPYTRDDHMMAYKWLAQQVHTVNPDLRIEFHDLMTVMPYCPVYLGYRHGGGWDEMWGYEMMWGSPAEELRSGKGLVAYYYNLAYDIPIYLHINLQLDNPNALGLWWFASTCRHLGIGGTNPDPKVVKVQQEAMKLYRSLKSYFVNGKFVGLSEMAHLHTLPGKPGGVLNLFNPGDAPATVSCEIPAGELQVPANTSMLTPGADQDWSGDLLKVHAELPAASPLVVVVRPAQ
ncbi:MAG: hypothetical protein M1608_10440 [Candidatus Omnitrophica bacterium]|nr:hypothetical protein [Candidatus Omnitrophota bacterium]